MARPSSGSSAGGKSRAGSASAASAAGRLLERLRVGKDVRAQKVRRLRAAVRAGRYENDLKLAVAVDRLLDELR